jgi:AcrR family transcriptional regulator
MSVTSLSCVRSAVFSNPVDSLMLTVASDTEFQQVILSFSFSARAPGAARRTPREGAVVTTDILETGTTDPMAAAIDVFTRQGYDATSVDDLADAVALSRSTFFRRFGSKEDVVFADHELLLTKVKSYLDTSPLAPLQAVCAAGRLVFEHHVHRREVSVARFSLLHDVPALRDRELITSHRYERAFTQYLRAALPETPDREYVSVGFSAGAVALHNATLRRWLFAPDTDLAPQLNSQLRALTRSFSTKRDEPQKSRIVVTVIEPGTDPDTVLETIRATLV